MTARMVFAKPPPTSPDISAATLAILHEERVPATRKANGALLCRNGLHDFHSSQFSGGSTVHPSRNHSPHPAVPPTRVDFLSHTFLGSAVPGSVSRGNATKTSVFNIR